MNCLHDANCTLFPISISLDRVAVRRSRIGILAHTIESQAMATIADNEKA